MDDSSLHRELADTFGHLERLLGDAGSVELRGSDERLRANRAARHVSVARRTFGLP